MKVWACRGLNVVLENTWACFIGPNINGFMGLLLTSVKKRGGYTLNLTVTCNVNIFSYSTYVSLP